MYPHNVIREKLAAHGVHATMVDLGTTAERDAFVSDKSATAYLLNDGLSDGGWAKFAGALPRAVVVGVHGSEVRVSPSPPANPVFHTIYVAAE